MIRICSKCGALLMDDAEPCSFCDEPSENSDKLQPVGAAKSCVEAAAEPEWRIEVGRRLQQYRKRKGIEPPEEQSPLPFREPERSRATSLAASEMVMEQRDGLREEPKPKPKQASRARSLERVEICIQPELDFSSRPGERARPQTALVPVASLGERRKAALIDGLFILLTGAAFVGLFVGLIHSMGGRMILDRMDAVMTAPVLFLFYSLYFLVFTFFAGVTPGMQFCGLSVVRLDGRLPDTPQLMWRGIGYLLSAATLVLGFLWALWDEDGFTWQDRISQTYITSAAPLTAPDPVEFTRRHR